MTRRMTHALRGPATCPGPRAGIPAAAIAALLLGGCSSGHIGDSWQCPLATGGACDSVAAADPAVPDASAARKSMLGEPLWRQRAGAPRSSAPEPCESDCGGFDPFGWLMRLFGAGDKDGPSVKTNSPPAADAARPSETGPEPAAAADVPVPAESAPGEDGPGDDSLRGDDLRTGEVLARIWIAPFVDANGVYREASHVRVVLAPAGWRLP